MPFSNESSVDVVVCVQGFGMCCLDVPLHTNYLESDLVTGLVVVGVHPCFPIKGKNCGEGKVVVKPEVTAVPVVSEYPDF